MLTESEYLEIFLSAFLDVMCAYFCSKNRPVAFFAHYQEQLAEFWVIQAPVDTCTFACISVFSFCCRDVDTFKYGLSDVLFFFFISEFVSALQKSCFPYLRTATSH